MLILKLGNVYVGLLKITGKQGGYFESGYTRAEVIKLLLDKIK